MASSNKGFAYDLVVGQSAENRLAELLGAGAKVEVKNDLQAHRTGRVYVEIESRGKPGGIMHTEAQWWVYFLDDDLFVGMRTERMQQLVETRIERFGEVRGGDANTSVGALIPVNDLVRGKPREA